MKSNFVKTQISLTALDVLDAPELRRWFAGWLRDRWQWVCQDAMRTLPPVSYNRAFNRMVAAMDKLSNRLPKLPASKQFLTVQQAAAKCGLVISQDRLLVELRFDLNSPEPANKPDYKKPMDMRN